jgi:hypothetical protein
VFGKFLKTERRAPDLSHDLGRFCGPHASFSSRRISGRRAHAYATHQIRSKYACPLANATPNWSGIRRIQATLTHPRTEGHAWKTWTRRGLVSGPAFACRLGGVKVDWQTDWRSKPCMHAQYCLSNFVIFRKPIKTGCGTCTHAPTLFAQLCHLSQTYQTAR